MNTPSPTKKSSQIAGITLICGIIAICSFLFFIPSFSLYYGIFTILLLVLWIMASISGLGFGTVSIISIVRQSIPRTELPKVIIGLSIELIPIVLTGIFILLLPSIQACVKRNLTNDNMKQLYMLIMMYEKDYDTFPKVTPEGGNGVRDLYPLFSVGLLEERSIVILQPPDTHLLPFSENPTIDEFDKDYIGLSYNSTAPYDETNTIPLLADQGVSSGYLQLKTDDAGIKPREKRGAIVVFSSGHIDFIRAGRQGKLSTNMLSKTDWSLLKD